MGSCPIPFQGLALRTLTVALVTVLHLLGWTYSDLVAEQVNAYYSNPSSYPMLAGAFHNTWRTCGVGAIAMILCYLHPPNTALAACRRKCRRLAYRLRRHLLMPMTGIMMMTILLKIVIVPSHLGEEKITIVCGDHGCQALARYDVDPWLPERRGIRLLPGLMTGPIPSTLLTCPLSVFPLLARSQTQLVSLTVIGLQTEILRYNLKIQVSPATATTSRYCYLSPI